MAPMPHRDPGCVACLTLPHSVLRIWRGKRDLRRGWLVFFFQLALGTIVLGGAEVALFMTEWAAVANGVFYRAEYPGRVSRRAFPACRPIGQTGGARYMAAAMAVDRGTDERLAWRSKGEGGFMRITIIGKSNVGSGVARRWE